jgi:hypothetical protein
MKIILSTDYILAMSLSVTKMLKSIKTKHIVMVLLALVVLYLLYAYGSLKFLKMDTLDGSQPQEEEAAVPEVTAESPVETGYAKQATATASDLMPLSTSDKFSNDLTVGLEQNVSSGMLTAGQMIGTVSQVNKNPNLQVRSEDANPMVETGPWNKSSIVPDTSKRTFEIN